MIYIGSKNQISREVISLITQNHSDYYVEPFCGGCNIIDKVDIPNRIANDNNEYLIEMWKTLQSGWEPEFISKEMYIDIRDNKNNYPKHLVGYAGFVCSYRGKWFGGYARDNVKKKRGNEISHYQRSQRNNIMKQAPLIKNVDFRCGSYLNLDIPLGSIIYCDPPYENTTKYSSGGFNHVDFWNWAARLSQTSYVYVSEYTAPEIFRSIWSKSVYNKLAANGTTGKIKNAVENLFVCVDGLCSK